MFVSQLSTQCTCQMVTMSKHCVFPWLGECCGCYGVFRGQGEAEESGGLDSSGRRPQSLAQGPVHHPAGQRRSQEWSSAAVTTPVSGETNAVTLPAARTVMGKKALDTPCICDILHYESHLTVLELSFCAISTPTCSILLLHSSCKEKMDVSGK